MNQDVIREAAGTFYVIIAFLLGGGTAVVAVGMFANAILKSPVLIKVIESLAKNVDPALLASLNATAKVLDEATDQIPAADKVVNPPSDLAFKLNVTNTGGKTDDQ